MDQSGNVDVNRIYSQLPLYTGETLKHAKKKVVIKMTGDPLINTTFSPTDIL